MSRRRQNKLLHLTIRCAAAGEQQGVRRLMLRQAVESDIPGIQRVRRSVTENRLESLVITDQDVREAITESGRGWVVELEDEVVAFAIGNAKSGNIWALFVHPDYERRGYGRRLHDAMVSWLWSHELERLWLTTEPGTRAQTFYEAAGWQLIGPTSGGELKYELPRPDNEQGSTQSSKIPGT